jgi:hypothetical protein
MRAVMSSAAMACEAMKMIVSREVKSPARQEAVHNLLPKVTGVVMNHLRSAY